MNPSVVRQMIVDNYGGVRIDGTNATIIGNKQENLLQTEIILPVYGWIMRSGSLEQPNFILTRQEILKSYLKRLLILKTYNPDVEQHMIQNGE